MATSGKTIAKNTVFLYIRMLVVMVVSLYTSKVILHTLGATDYGIYNVVGGIVTMMAFFNGALGASSSRFLTYELGIGNMEQLKKTFSASLNLHIGVALLVLLVGETAGMWFFYEKLLIPAERLDAAFWVYQFSIITTMVSITQVPFNASLIAHENMSVYAYVGLYEAIARLIIAYLISISTIDKLIFYGLLLLLNTTIVQFFYRWYASSHYLECHFSIVKDKVLYRQLLSYGGWDLFGGVAVVSQGQGINILLNIFFGPMVNAARAIAFQIQGATMQFVNNFLVAIRPQVVKSYAEGNVGRMYSLTFYAAKFGYMMMLALTLPISFEIDFVLDLWLGNSVPKHTNVFSVIVLLTYLMETFHSASLMSYHAIGKIKLGNIVGGILMISALPLGYLLLKLGFPAYSVFIGIFLVNLIQMFFGWWVIHHYIPFKYIELIKKVYIPSVIVTIMSVITPIIIKNSMDEGLFRFSINTLSTEIILFFSVFYVGLTRYERECVVNIIKSKIKL